MVGQRPGFRGPFSHLTDQGRHTLVHIGARLLHQAVRVQDEGLTRQQLETGLRELLVHERGRDPQREPPADLGRPHPPVGVPDQRPEVPGARHADGTRGKVRLGVRARRETVGVQLGQEPGGARQHRRRRVSLGGVRAQGDAELSHDRGRVGVVSLDIAHHHPDPAPGQRDHVVPVTADLAPAPRRVVPDRDLPALHGLDPPGEHGRLESGRELAFLVEQLRPLQRLRHDGGQPETEKPLVGAEGRWLAVEQGQRAQGTRLGDQREIGGGAESQLVHMRFEQGIPPDQVRERGGEHRAAAEHGVPQWQPAVEFPGPQAAVHLQGVTAQRDDVERRVVHQPQRQSVRAQHGETGRPRERGGDVVHRQRPRQCAGRTFDDVGLMPAPFLQIQHRRRMRDLRRGVTQYTHDTAGPAVTRPQDPRLDVGPLAGTVRQRHLEMHAVRAAPLGDGLVDRDGQPGSFGRVQPFHQGLRARVESRRVHVEDRETGFVDVQGPRVQIPLEGARPVQGKALGGSRAAAGAPDEPEKRWDRGVFRLP